MADWYVSSAAYAGVSAWVGSHVYSIGDLVKPTAPAAGKEYVFRVTTAGTSTTEPSWPANNAATVTAGPTFTNVSGQSTYGWGAAAGTLNCLCGVNRTVATATGDRIFISSDHSESFSTAAAYAIITTAAFGLVQIISVNRAGSVPPVSADITSGASITNSSTTGLVLNAAADMFWQGITFTVSATGASAHLSLNDGSANMFKAHYLKDCTLKITGTNTGQQLRSANSGSKVTLDNTTVQFGATGQFISGGSNTAWMEMVWQNTPSAIQGATLPTTLFTPGGLAASASLFTCRGVDLSAITGTLQGFASGTGTTKVLLDSCKIASAVTRQGTPASNSSTSDEIELVNCWDGSNVLNERYSAAGAVTTDRSTYLTGGAADDVGNYSLKLASSSRSDKYAFTLDCFTLDVENTATGSSKTATVEIVSSGSLNNDDISLLLEYMGTSGNPVASFVSSLPATLTAGSAVTTSTAAWTSPPSTPVYQKLQVTFAPQRAGRVRAKVSLGKASTTVWINPQVAIT